MKGISLKTRFRIDKGVGVWKPKSERSGMVLIGSEEWNEEVRATLDCLRHHRYRYSESSRLDRASYYVNSVLKNIYLATGIWPAPSRPSRKVGRRRSKRRLALQILNELHGVRPTLSLDTTSICVRPGKLDARLEWLLFEIYSPRNDNRGKNFLITVAKDAGVWPPPEWWRVTRILLGDKRFLKKGK